MSGLTFLIPASEPIAWLMAEMGVVGFSLCKHEALWRGCEWKQGGVALLPSFLIIHH